MLTSKTIISYKNNIILLFIFTFFSSLVFDRGLFIIYLLYCDLSNTQIGLLQGAFFFVSLLSEIPAGVFGDIFGRKTSMIIGLGLDLFFVLGMIFGATFIWFLFIFIIKGLSKAFNSGSDIALFYDSLKIIGRESEYLELRSKLAALSNFAMGSAIIIGGGIAEISWKWLYISCAVPLFIAILCLFFLKENVEDYQAMDSSSENDNRKNKSSSSLYTFLKLKSTKILLVLICSWALFDGVMGSFFNYGQSLFNELSISPKMISLIFGIVYFITGYSYIVAEKVIKRFSLIPLLNLTIILTAILLFLNYLANPWVSIALFLSLNLMPEVVFLAVETHCQDKIPSTIRASFLSVNAFMSSLFIGAFYIIFGALFDVFPIYLVISLSGLFFIFSLLGLNIYFKYSKQLINP